ncbi:FdrA family protein [Nocardioides sp.]|uniref:FdrA family protein n=1 Tax=Nocardioides sp. TaxID=35761 RepID=UPI002633E64E|nr:FdrA family protein [Nocardioides sp.]MDI6911336.1 FdrA family protein [Nocardioides sp.]
MSTPDPTHVELRPGAYADSVTLLQVSRVVQGLAGVLAAQVAMATPLNIEVLTGMGFEVPAQAGPNDLVVALRLEDADALAAALAGVDQALRDANRRDDGAAVVAPPRTTASALRRSADTSGHDAVALVSVPGAHAFVEAMDAVEAGRDVMVFSDNVPLDQELALKRAAAERGVLVMGPDCGTAVIDGVGLGFANVVTPGPVGIVAASGTGCQQLLALLDHAGVGVTSALGVGGRDLSAEVRGLATREALRRLDEDPAVELIVLISKPPAADVTAEIEEYAASLATPVELALLGPGRPDLTAAAEAVLRRLGRDVPAWPVDRPAGSRPVSPGALRGLFVGGTLASEAALVASELLGEGGGHTFVDFGDDEYTTGRAHPMIDPSIRLEHLARAAADPATGVLLLDVVLGHGAEPDPAESLAPALAGVEQPVVVAVVGTAGDPQGRDRQVRALVDAGAEVHLSNAGATRRAIELLGETR